MRKPIKGPARATRHRAARSIARETLGRELEEEIFRRLKTMSEGAVREGIYFGSVMMTCDLAELVPTLRERADEGLYGRIARLVEASVRARFRIVRLAREEVARRMMGFTLGTAALETRVALSGTRLHVDVDVEVPLATVASRAR
jgi:hypothetical protein